ncbi:MAG: hypothetical protein Q4G71_12315, partial [Pseudomonadota bacterium]|nr:hypothetical protein [Pseudomonadota bacterium]
ETISWGVMLDMLNVGQVGWGKRSEPQQGRLNFTRRPLGFAALNTNLQRLDMGFFLEKMTNDLAALDGFAAARHP